MEEKLESQVVRARTCEEVLSRLLEQQRGFILGCAAKVCGRYITPQDDEWSVALSAFSQAVQDYRQEKGDFLPFARQVIRNDLIDYLRSQGKYRREVPVDPSVFAPSAEAGASWKLERREGKETPGFSLREEIQSVSQIFGCYGFTFFQLADCCPRAEKTKKACAQAVQTLLAQKELLDQLEQTCQLPIRGLEEASGVSRKLLDRHRKYIIAAAVILSGDYPGLREYFPFMRKER